MRLVARFGLDLGEAIEIKTFYKEKDGNVVIQSEKENYKSITSKYPAAIWFERKIKDDFGVRFEGSFDERMLTHHERFPNISPMLKSFDKKEIPFDDFKPYDYEVIRGDGVFEVGVGPIHAGIIEPGHFQFSQEGENMLHLEVRHFYKYKAIEKMVEGKNPLEIFDIVEKISGNESIAYQKAYLKLLSQASSQEIPLDIRKYNALLLELERLIHHITDLGFIPNDAGFSSALAFCSQKSEELRRVLNDITGHRFGFGSVRGGSRSFDTKSLEKFLSTLEKEMKWFRDWILDIPSLLDRFDTTGILSTKNSIIYSTVGVIARASGLKNDARNKEQFYTNNGFELQREGSGDVSARFKVRIKEVFNSIEMIRNFLDFTEDKMKIDNLIDGEYYSFAESSIGELFLFLKIKDGVVDRFYVRDPSFINWQALHLMMSGNIIADFPLINKSCDLSYAGNDL
jgi:Ni,Fe-hydrogenase III large subunit